MIYHANLEFIARSSTNETNEHVLP